MNEDPNATPAMTDDDADTTEVTAEGDAPEVQNPETPAAGAEGGVEPGVDGDGDDDDDAAGDDEEETEAVA